MENMLLNKSGILTSKISMPLGGVVSSIRCFSPNDKRLAIEYINHCICIVSYYCANFDGKCK